MQGWQRGHWADLLSSALSDSSNYYWSTSTSTVWPPPFVKFGSAVDPPSRLFFFFLSEQSRELHSHSFLLRVGLVISLLFLQHKLSESWGGELLTGAQMLLLWGCCPASVYLFILLIRVRMVADGWVRLFFMLASTLWYVRLSHSSIPYIFPLGLIKKNAAVTDIFFPDPVDISALSSVTKTIIVVEVGISEGWQTSMKTNFLGRKFQFCIIKPDKYTKRAIKPDLKSLMEESLNKYSGGCKHGACACWMWASCAMSGYPHLMRRGRKRTSA